MTKSTADERWAVLVRKATARLLTTQEVLPAANPSGRWEADSDRGRFVMRDERGVATACADFAFIGTYSTASGSFLWAWANQSIPAKEREVSRRVKDYGVREDFAPLVAPRVPCTEREALEIAAVAWDILNAEAPYKFAMTPTSTGYLALFSVRTGADASKLEPAKAP